MLGGDDLRPEARRRAPDLSLHEMLRRARQARLGDSFLTTTANVQTPRFVPHTGNEQRAMQVRWLHSCAVFILGILLGVFATYTVVRISGSVGGTSASVVAQSASDSASLAPMQPTDTPLPTPTDIPVPTSTTTPNYPSADDIVSLAQAYIENQSDYAGSYVMTGDTLLQIKSEDETELTVCIQFDLASIAAPDTVAGTDTRTFVMSLIGDGTWQVIEMDGSGSCSLG